MSEKKRIELLIKRIVAGAPMLQLKEELKGVDLDAIGLHGRTLLMAAAMQGRLDVVEELVRSGASVLATGDRRMTALHESSASGEVMIVEFLLSRGAFVDSVTVDDVTPLMCAAAWGHLEVVRLLLNSGADRAKRDCMGDTASDIAREKGEDGIADLIDSHSVRVADK